MEQTYIYQGRNFISSKRASEISDYASDYIGQLCRAGKLECQRVGHVWFLTEESLRAHMTKVWSADNLRSRADNLKKRFIKDGQTTGGSTGDGKSRITSKQASLMSGYAADYIGQLCRAGKLDAVMVGKTWMVVEESLKEHLEKIRQEELQKIEEKKRENQIKLVESRLRERAIEVEQVREVVKVTKTPKVAEVQVRENICTSALTNPISVNPYNSLLRNAITTIASVIVIVMVGSMAVMRIAGSDNGAVRQPLVASVYNAAISVNDFMTGRGMAVAPSTGDQNSDVVMQTAIKDSFSDQVNIAADKSGTAGVITPVFKKTNGKEFMYVMVPVKDAADKATTTATVSTNK